MPSKTVKKGSAKKSTAAGAAAATKNWEAGLTGAQFEEVRIFLKMFVSFCLFIYLFICLT